MRPGRLLARYLAALAVGLTALTLLTQRLFAVLEGRHLAWHQALLFVVESMSTTGYGELLPFRSPWTTMYAVALIALGFGFVIVGLGAVATRWFAARFAELPPERAPSRLRRHVVVAGQAPLVEALHAAMGPVPVLVIDPRPEVVATLVRRGRLAMVGDPSEAATLQAARLQHARALVAAGTDAANAAVLLTARSLQPGLRCYATVEHVANAGFLQAAGALAAVSAKAILGEALGRWAAAAAGPGSMALVLGAGDVGQAALAALASAGVAARALSLAGPGGGAHWQRGDATDAAALTAAGIASASACVVALDDDSCAVFAALVVRGLVPELPIAARSNSKAALDDLKLAGADYVLSVAEVAGSALAALLQGQGTAAAQPN